MLNPLTVSQTILPVVDKQLLFLGDMELGNEVVASIARGEIHPSTHESYAWKEASAAYLTEQQQQRKQTKLASVVVNSTRSLTSSETGSLVQSDAEAGVPNCDLVSHCDSSRPHAILTACHRQEPRGIGEMQLEKPRPSSSSSWGHLNSLLGSSVHILNFRSPKVSDTFKPLNSLERRHEGTSGSLGSDVRCLENQVVRTQVKRVCNPATRRWDERGSGFDGEVLCRVNSSRPTFGSTNGPNANPAVVDLTSDSPAMVPAITGRGEKDNEIDAQLPTLSTKRKRLRSQEVSEHTAHSEYSEPVKLPRLVRPIPFRSFPVAISKAPQSVCGSVRSISAVSPQSASPTPPSSVSYARATFAEAKWDRILADELDSDQDEPSVNGCA